MEMRSVETIPVGPDWQYEPKWDGFRAIVHRDGDDVAIISKNGQPLSRYFPEIVAALTAVAGDHFSLDGELVVPLAGALSFDALQQRIHPAATRVAMLARTTPAYYLVFDLLREDGNVLVELPLHERRARLERFAAALPNAGTLRLSPVTTDRSVVDAWFERVGGALDGVIAKRRDRPYTAGKTDAAVKIKKARSADCVIGGFRYAADGQDRVGSLLLGLYDDDVDCSTTSDFAARLRPWSGAPSSSACAPTRAVRDLAAGAPDMAASRWNRGAERDRFCTLRYDPELVLEVAFDQVTGGRIRHGTKPVRWRTDKSPRQCTLDQLETAGSVLGLLEN